MPPTIPINKLLLALFNRSTLKSIEKLQIPRCWSLLQDRELVSLVKIKSLTVTGSSEANKVIIDDFAILKTLECLDLGEYDTPLDLSPSP